MKGNYMQSRREKFYRILPYVVLLGAYIFSVAIYARLGAHNLDADRSSEMILANLLNEEGRLLSENWYYSTELRVVSPVPVYQLGLMLFDSWHYARTFAIAVLLAGVAASFLYLMRSVGIGDAAVYCVACFILPISWLSMFMFVYGQFYSVYFILICMILGLMLRIDRNRIWNIIRIALIVVLSIWGGMQGVRLLMMCAMPLVLSVCVLMSQNICKSKSVRELLHARESVYAILALVICIGMCAGYLINTYVLSEHYTFKNFSQTLMYSLDFEEVAKQINYLPQYFGFENGVAFVSADGLINAIAVLMVFVMVFSACALVFRCKTLSAAERLFVWFAVFSVLLGIAVNSMTIYGNTSGKGSLSYYLPGLLLLISLAFICVDKSRMGMPGVKAAALLFMTTVFVLNSVHYIRKNMRVADADYEVTADWLVENGYQNGFTTFWNSSILTEASDGYLQMYTFGTWKDTELNPWLQEKEHLESLPEGKVFVFVPKLDKDVSLLAQDDHLIQQTADGWIYEYGSAQEVMEIQRGKNK